MSGRQERHLPDIAQLVAEHEDSQRFFGTKFCRRKKIGIGEMINLKLVVELHRNAGIAEHFQIAKDSSAADIAMRRQRINVVPFSSLK